MRYVYADNSATTALSPKVLEKMMPYLTEVYGNPSRQRKFTLQQAEVNPTTGHSRVFVTL